MRPSIAACLAAIVLIQPAAAADVKGMAVVAGAEVGFGKCLGTSETEATACAIEACRASAPGDPALQCEPVAWCARAGYGGVVTINDSQGFTFAKYPCDAPSEPELADTLREICERALAEGANGCSVTAAWDDRGETIEITDAMSAPLR